MPFTIGIDLGTTNSCVAVFQDGSPKIIETKEGKNTIPSYVFYDNENEVVIVGEDAVKRAAIKPKHAIYDSKRLIGRKYDEHIMENSSWPFVVNKSGNGEYEITVTRNGKEQKIRPEEVSAEILRTLKENAENDLNEKIVNAVITIPAYFTHAQRQATKDAARIVGLNVVKLLQEPTAAALAFAYGDINKKDRTILVYDLGGGTFDVSLIKYSSNNKIRVLAVSGDNLLGGRDFDSKLLVHILGIIDTKLGRSLNDLKKRRVKRRLERECENIKVLLSSCESAEYELYEVEDQNLLITVTRQTFEVLNHQLFEDTINIVDQLLTDANMNKKKIDEILLVGGSTRIPKIQQMVQGYFDGKELNKTVNPDEAVAIGAAIQAALSSDHPLQATKKFELLDVTPRSLGIEVIAKDTMNVIIKNNTQIPCLVEKTYYTFYDFQTTATIRIFEGEAPEVKQNVLLGEFTVEGFTAKPKGQVKFIVTFELDVDGILKVTAKETSKNISNNLHIVLVNGRLTNEEIGRAHQRMMSFSNRERRMTDE